MTNQSVEALPGVAGVRWYEIRRTGGTYSVFQQGTFAPNDGVHRWMGSIAQDKNGNMALGYSVVNGTTVFPGIRYTGRLAGDPLGQMTLGEGTIINGAGVQTTTNSRWGDYTDITVDPSDDSTFWYVNEYYQVSGLPLPTPTPPLPPPGTTAPWQTRIGNVLAGRTLGVIGLGRLGERVARVGLAFEAEVLAWSTNLDPERARSLGVEPVSKSNVT